MSLKLDYQINVVTVIDWETFSQLTTDPDVYLSYILTLNTRDPDPGTELQ